MVLQIYKMKERKGERYDYDFYFGLLCFNFDKSIGLLCKAVLAREL